MGDSEILRVKHSVESHIPAFGKFADDCLNVAAIVGMEQRRHVFNDHPSGLKASDCIQDFEDESTALACKTSFRLVSLSCRHVRNILAGESEGDAGDVRQLK